MADCVEEEMDEEAEDGVDLVSSNIYVEARSFIEGKQQIYEASEGWQNSLESVGWGSPPANEVVRFRGGGRPGWRGVCRPMGRSCTSQRARWSS